MSKEPNDKGLPKFAAEALRGPKRGIYQQLLAGLLVKANRANDSLIKISSVCEAAYMSRQKDDLNMELVETASKVCRSFVNTEVTKENLVRVTWTFPQTEENWKEHIRPWHKITLRYFAWKTALRYDKYPLKLRYGYWDQMDANKLLDLKEEIKKEIKEEVNKMPEHKAFFEITTALGKYSFYALKGEFEHWVLKQLLEVQTAIAEEIDPQVWREALGLPKPEKEEGEEAGDQMGPGK